MTERTCSVESCGGKHVAQGFCGKHYQRWNNGADVARETTGETRRKTSLEGQPHSESPDGICVVPGCDRPVRVPMYGWCGMHHARWLKTGDVQPHRPSRDARREDGWLWCSSCETHKAPDDFYRNQATKTGRDGICKGCARKRRDEQREHRLAVSRTYRAKNREHIKATKRAAYHRNPEKSTEAGRAWRKANPDRVRQQIRAQNLARYARGKKAPGTCSVQQLLDRWDYYQGKCWICGAPATDTDHVKPLAAGGSHWPANLRPACQRCNRSKGSAWPFALEVARARRTSHREAA